MCLAVPGKIMQITGEGLECMGKVSFGGVLKEVSLAYVPQAALGDYVLVHVGFALNIIDEDEAQRVFEALDALEEENDALY